MYRRVIKIMFALFAVAIPVMAVALPSVGVAAGAQPTTPSDFINLVNNLRAINHVTALSVDPTMMSVAQTWANTMASSESLSHNPNEATQVPSGWTKMGENIGDGFSLQAVYAFLVASPPHYANMVDPTFNRTGVGVATDSKGQVWVAEDLGDYPPPTAPVIVFPTTGSKIFSSSQSFSWQQVTGASIYCLTVGSTQGAMDLFNSGDLNAPQLSVTVPALPISSSLWVRVYSFIGGTWTWTDANFSVI
jgi:Cysteine-rich secretory protein family